MRALFAGFSAGLLVLAAGEALALHGASRRRRLGTVLVAGDAALYISVRPFSASTSSMSVKAPSASGSYANCAGVPNPAVGGRSAAGITNRMIVGTAAALIGQQPCSAHRWRTPAADVFLAADRLPCVS